MYTRVRVRAHMLLLASGYSWATIAGVLFCSTRTIASWKTLVAEGKSMPDVFEVSQYLPIGQAIEKILLITECSLEGEWGAKSAFCRCASFLLKNYKT